MDGKELYERVVSTVQETSLKIGEVQGSVSLFYPYSGDLEELKKGFMETADPQLRDVVIETLPGRIRVVVSEKECAYISGLPVKQTMADIIRFTKERIPLDAFMEKVKGAYPLATFTEMDHLEFDMLMTFPEELDADFYCLSEEMSQVSFHRFSKDDYQAFGFPMPISTQDS